MKTTEQQFPCLSHVIISVFRFGKRTKEAEFANGTGGSQAATHPSTNPAQRCLTSVIGRELVCSTWYGRWHSVGANLTYTL